MCHVSHVYESGASLYFTFIARQREGEEIAQWRAVKDAASEAILAGGGTITHHHAVGRDHAPWMEREIGGEGIEVLRAREGRARPRGSHEPGQAARGRTVAEPVRRSAGSAGCVEAPRSTTWPGCVGRVLVSRVSRISL